MFDIGNVEDGDVNNDDPVDNALQNETDIVNDDPIAIRRSKRNNAGGGVKRLEMNFSGKEYESKTKHHLFMRKAKYIKLTQMLAYKGFKVDKERALVAMFKGLKQLNDGPMEGKRVI